VDVVGRIPLPLGTFFHANVSILRLGLWLYQWIIPFMLPETTAFVLRLNEQDLPLPFGGCHGVRAGQGKQYDALDVCVQVR